MNTENNIHLFDKYLKEEQSEQERNAFERQLKADSNFRADFEAHQNLVAQIRTFERDRLKTMLLNTPAATTVRTLQSRNTFQQHWLKIAVAAAVVLFVVGRFFFAAPSNERIYANFQLNDQTINQMCLAPDVTTQNRFQYENALALRGGGEMQAAIAAFDEVSDENINLYFLAQYDKALLQIKTGQRSEAQKTLTALVKRTENHFIKKKAKKILSIID